MAVAKSRSFLACTPVMVRSATRQTFLPSVIFSTRLNDSVRFSIVRSAGVALQNSTPSSSNQNSAIAVRWISLSDGNFIGVLNKTHKLKTKTRKKKSLQAGGINNRNHSLAG